MMVHATDASSAEMYDWNSVQVFLAVHRGGSLKEAARVLSISVSTVSRRISALEQDLGVQLFDRNLEGLRPTAAAGRIVEHARQVERAAHALDAETQHLSAELAGVVRVATLPALGADVIGPALGELRALHPKLVVEMHLRPQVADLSRNDADIALRIPRPRDGSLVAKRIGMARYAVFGSAQYLAQNRDVALDSHAWVGWPAELSALPEAAWLETHVPAAQIVSRCDDLHGIARLCEVGLGLALLPSALVGAYPTLEQLQGIAEPLPSFPLWLTAHQSRRHTPRVAVVWTFLEALLAERLVG